MPDQPDEFSFLPPASGEMGERLRAYDWSSTPLGRPAGWPTALKTTLGTLLTARFPMFLGWGPQHIYFYNDAFIEILAARHPSALGRPFRDLAPEAWDELAGLVGQAMAGRPVYHENLPFTLMRRGYEEKTWFTVSYSPVYDGGPAAAGFLGVCIETTHEVLAAQARRDEIERLREMFEQAPGPIAVLSGPDHRYEISNAINQRFLGNRDVIGKPVREAVPEIIAQGVGDILDDVYRTGKPFVGRRMPVSAAGADGGMQQFYVDVVFQPMRDRHGQVSGIFMQSVDVSETVNAIEALRKSEQRFRTITDAMPQMVWTAAADGSVTYCNQRWYDYTGLTPGNTLGDAWRDVLHPDDIPRINASWGHSLAAGTPHEERHRVRHHSGEFRWMLVRALPVRDDAGRIVEWLGTNTDIHEQVLAEQALQDANRRKDEFLAMLAHELRNPLAPIATATQLLKLPGVPAARVGHAIDVVDRQVRHMTELVDDLLDVSRVTRGLVELERGRVDLRATIAAAVEQARPLIDARRHVLTLRQQAGEACVTGDRTRLVQVVVNLLTNAAKYSPEGSGILLALDTVDGNAEIRVVDEGIGIDADLLPHVFDLFVQAERTPDRAQGGLGIGLALVRSIVQLHGGQVKASSTGRGRGSTFTVTLPLTGAAGEAAAAPAQEAARAADTLDILVVDDNADAAQMLAECLGFEGHRVRTCGSARAALAAARERPPQVCILDIGLPDMTGHALAAQLWSLPDCRATACIAVSGYGQPHDVAQSRDAGFTEHFVKPVDLRRLGDCLRDIARAGEARGGTQRPSAGAGAMRQ